MTEQDKFEQWYALVHCPENGFHNVTVEEIRGKRTEDEDVAYGDYRYLNGCYEGWKGKSRYTGLTDMGFILDAANEGELAAYDHACAEANAAFARVIDGEDTGAGVSNEPWESIRRRAIALREDAERYRWLREQPYLNLLTDGGIWTRSDGSTYYVSHVLSAGRKQFATFETLDGTIDNARKG